MDTLRKAEITYKLMAIVLADEQKEVSIEEECRFLARYFFLHESLEKIGKSYRRGEMTMAAKRDNLVFKINKSYSQLPTLTEELY